MCIRQRAKKLWIETKEMSEFATHNREVFFDLAKNCLLGCERILDIGSGSGGFIKFLGRKDVYALDGNSDSVNNLIDLGVNAICGNLPNIPFPDNYFDGVHISHVLEHMHEEDVYDTLKEIDRILKKRGVLVISGPVLWDAFYEDLSHVKPYYPKIFTSYLCDDRLSQSSTRPRIGGYKTKTLIYRYKIQGLNPIMVRHFHVLNFVSILFSKTLRKIGIGHFKKTGFTIILEKVDETRLRDISGR